MSLDLSTWQTASRGNPITLKAGFSLTAPAYAELKA